MVDKGRASTMREQQQWPADRVPSHKTLDTWTELEQSTTSDPVQCAVEQELTRLLNIGPPYFDPVSQTADWGILEGLPTNYSKNGQPGPMTLVYGRAEGATASSGAPCVDTEKVWDTANSDGIWSASKLLTAVTALAVVDDDSNDLTLDTPLHVYFEYWTDNPDDPRSAVTLKHLLSQTAGFGDHGCCKVHTGQLDKLDLYKPVINDTISYASCAKMGYQTAYAKHSTGVNYESPNSGAVIPPFNKGDQAPQSGVVYPAESEVRPGSYFSYNDLNWQLTVALVEQVTGLSFDGAVGRYVRSKLQIGKEEMQLPPPHGDPAGGWLSSASAFGKVVAAVFDNSLLSKQTTDAMDTPWTKVWNTTSLTVQLIRQDPSSNFYNDVEGYTGQFAEWGLGNIVLCLNHGCDGTNAHYMLGGRGFGFWYDRRNEYWAVLARGAPYCFLNNDCSGFFPGPGLANEFHWGTAYSQQAMGMLAAKMVATYNMTHGVVSPSTECVSRQCAAEDY